jgi:hypothetical protein
VRAGHGAHWIDELAFLLGGCVQPVVSQIFPAAAVSGTATYHVAYQRSPGVHVLLLEAELPVIADAAGRCTLAVACTTGTVTLLETDGGAPFDGAQELPAASAAILRPAVYRGVLAVGALSLATVHDLVFTVAPVASASTIYPRSLYRLHVVEVPVADVDPIADAAGEIAADAAWPHVLNPLTAGSSSTARGFVRLVAEADRARTHVVHHWQIVADETGTLATAVGFAGTSDGVATTAGILTVIEAPP